MVELTVTHRVQQALVTALEKRFDGDAYIGAVQNPKFIIDFFANDRTVVTSDDIEEFIEDFTATYDGVHSSAGGDTYSVNIVAVPENNYKYQFVLEVQAE